MITAAITAAVVGIVIGVWAVRLSLRSTRWVSTTTAVGTIEDVTLTTRNGRPLPADRPGSRSAADVARYVHVTYRFTARDGVERHGRDKVLFDVTGRGLRRWVERHPPGGPVDVEYEDAMPERSQLAANRWHEWIGGAILSALLIIVAATLVLTGGLYQILSLDVDEDGAVVFRAPTELRIKTTLSMLAKAKLIPDQTVAGLRASKMIVEVEGADGAGRTLGKDGDGDDAGRVSVRIGEQNLLLANIYAPNGTVWLQPKTQATGAFIGAHVRVGQKVVLTLDSAFR